MSTFTKHAIAPSEWLAQVREPALQPGQIIIDPHHHLWDRRENRYLLTEILQDHAGGGHRVVSTVYIQASSMKSLYWAGGDPPLAPVGETQFARGVAALCAKEHPNRARVCEGIVAHADLMLGAKVEEVLQAHIEMGEGRFKGIRHTATWDADARLISPNVKSSPGLLRDPQFRQGFAVLDRMGLVFDAWIFHPQIKDVADLAAAFPRTPIVLNHLGGILNVGAHAGKRDEVRSAWLALLRDLAIHQNVYLKLGGMGMPIFGFDYASRSKPPSSLELADDFAPYMLPAMEIFSPRRCMFESNFPVDKRSFSYGILWNAFKRLAQTMSTEERNDLFYKTAARVYRLGTDYVTGADRHTAM